MNSERLNLEDTTRPVKETDNKAIRRLHTPEADLFLKTKQKSKTVCPFNSFGCEHTDRNTQETHINQEPVKHLTLLCDATVLLKDATQALQLQWECLVSKFESNYIRHDRMRKRWGSHLIWRIDRHAERLSSAVQGEKPVIFSPPFVTARHGYRLILSVALNGDGKAKGEFMSLFIAILKGEHDSLLVWPFNHSIQFSLLSQADKMEHRRDIHYTLKPNPIPKNAPFLDRPKHERNPSFGAQKFAALQLVNSPDYVKDDVMYIRVQVDEKDMNVL